MADPGSAGGAGSVPADRPAPRSGYHARRRRTGLWLVAPALLVLLGVLAYPIADALILSFSKVTFAAGGIQRDLIGTGNYERLLTDATFGVALRNSLYFTFVEVIAVTLLSMLVAMLLNTPAGRRPIFPIILLIPWALAPVANAVLWKWIYNANYGVLNTLGMQLGLIDKKVVWLGDPWLALNMILVSDAWKAIPFISLLLLAGLQNIPGHLYRAAQVDGANVWARFRHVTLPGLRTPLLVAIVLQSIWALKVFDLVYVLTKGGPLDGTVVMNFLAWRVTFNFLDVGYGAAIANVLFVIMLVLAIGYVRTLGSERRRRTHAPPAPAAPPPPGAGTAPGTVA
ncbi:MAG: sugar ABC transporter permease [Chloroflexota bacterium]